MQATIRSAEPADAALIYDFICQLATYERAPDAVKATPERLRAQLSAERPPFECLIAEIEGEAVGFALFFHNYSTWTGKPGIYLEDLFVPVAHRRRGVGRALLVELARLAAQRDCGRLEWAVLDWNRPAIDFYHGLSAELLDAWRIFRLSGPALDALAASGLG